MKNRKKDILIIAVLFIFSIAAYYFVSTQSIDTNHIEVRGKNDRVILKANFDEDKVYEIDVKNGKMFLEVKDDLYRVVNVDCPDKICEKEGWVSKGEIHRVIHCLPNEVYVIQT